MKQCPFCAGDVQADASVCRHCGRSLPARSALPFPTSLLVFVTVLGAIMLLLAYCASAG
jgi:hypothetical protein